MIVPLPLPYLSLLYFLAILNAVSFASVPELQKYTLAIPLELIIFSPEYNTGSLKYKFEVCNNLSTCSFRAFFKLLLLYPREDTPYPLVKSIYLLPLVSKKQLPSP